MCMGEIFRPKSQKYDGVFHKHSQSNAFMNIYLLNGFMSNHNLTFLYFQKHIKFIL